MSFGGEDTKVATGAGVVLLTLCAGQFLMALDSSVMNVSIATVADDLDTSITGIQSAIVLYTLVMAMLMVTGGKIGSMIGRKRAFLIGLFIYCSGSLTTALAPNLGILLLGWSLLEGIGAALIMPAIVALIAGNFPPDGRPRAYGLVGAAGAIAIAVGPLIGGLATTYASWRWVFAGEVVIGAGIFLFSRRVADAPIDVRPRLDVLGSILWAAGMGLIVFAVLKSGEWGWFLPSEDAPTIFGMSPVIWLIVTGLVTLRLFGTHIRRLDQEGKEPLFSPSLIDQGLNGGLLMFLFQFIVMMGVFFVLPLFLSVALGQSAIETGLRITPLSVTMLLAAAGVPKFYPAASPRRVVTLGFVAVLIGIVALIGAMDVDASASVVTVPLLVIGLGLGALASQLGAVTVSAAPEELSPEVGGLQNTASQFGASLGTALAGSVMITALTASFLGLIAVNPDVPADVSDQATTELASGIPFISDQDLEAALDASSLDDETTDAILEDYGQARLEGIRTALSLLAVFAVIALFFTRRIPDRPPGSAPATAL
ncbi:MAG TPA: MFS transporter [Actinomycetota bacterium]|jgi:MFS family permease|nr:MFS transporter [Actinomycetota bacterium]